MNDKNFVQDFLNSIPQNARDSIHKINLSNNNIQNLQVYKNLGKIFRNLKELILDNNLIQNVFYLNDLASCTNLENLSYRSNPCENQSTGDLILPALKVVNGQPFSRMGILLTQQQINLPTVKELNIENSVRDVIYEFVQRFFQSFSQNRMDVLTAYDYNAIFSFTVSAESNHKGGKMDQDLFELRKKGHDVNFNQQQPPIVGQKAISNIFQHFPNILHDLSSLNVDAELLQIPNNVSRILLSVHGDIQLNGIIRSFDRTFVLCTPNQSSSQAGWKVTIVNDQLHISPKVDRTSLNFDSSAPAPSTTSSTSSSISFNTNGNPNLVQQLSQMTNMNEEYSTMCLQQSGWNLENALQLFNNVKPKLTEAAFKR